MPSVVVNSTPLIALAKIGRLDLLRELYGRVFIPPAVFDEVCAKRDVASEQLRANLDWIEVPHFRQRLEDVSLMPARLHAGEVEAIMLTRALEADYIILDDNAAKKTAEYLGFKVIGTLGVLITAKRLGLIDDIEAAISDLRRIGFWVSDRVLEMVRRAAE